MMTLTQALACSTVDQLIPVAASSIPARIRWCGQANMSKFWQELYCPLDGCRYGCKVYYCRQGAVLRYALIHSSTYGHR